MPTLDVIDLNKKKVGTVNLTDDVFATKVRVSLVHQVIKAQLASRRRGTAKTKVRREIQGGGKKPYRQKGTGNARQGSTRSPQFVGGGQNFGPTPRSYEQKTPKKMIHGALRSVLSDRVKEKRLMVVDNFKLGAAKTKEVAKVMKKLDLDKVLCIDEPNLDLNRSCRNLPSVKYLQADSINVYDIVRSEWVLMSKAAAEKVDARLKPQSKKKAN